MLYHLLQIFLLIVKYRIRADDFYKLITICYFDFYNEYAVYLFDLMMFAEVYISTDDVSHLIFKVKTVV